MTLATLHWVSHPVLHKLWFERRSISADLQLPTQPRQVSLNTSLRVAHRANVYSATPDTKNPTPHCHTGAFSWVNGNTHDAIPSTRTARHTRKCGCATLSFSNTNTAVLVFKTPSAAATLPFQPMPISFPWQPAPWRPGLSR